MPAEALETTDDLQERFSGKLLLRGSANSINTYSACSEKGHLYYDERIVPDRKADFLERGDLLHVMMESYYNDRKSNLEGKTDYHHDLSIDRAMDRGRSHFTTLGSVSFDDLDMVLDSFRHYAVRFENDGWEPFAVEQQFAVILLENESIVVIFEGKIDLGIHDAQGVPLIVDHKWMMRDWYSTLLSNQLMGYALATGIMNVALNKVGPQKDEALRFKRKYFSYTEAILEDWRSHAIYRIVEAEKLRRGDFFPKDFTSCDKFGGCIYRRVCSAEPDDRERIKRVEYRVREVNDLFERVEGEAEEV